MAERSLLQTGDDRSRLGVLDQSSDVFPTELVRLHDAYPVFASPSPQASAASPAQFSSVAGVDDEGVGVGGGDQDAGIADMQQWLEEFRLSRPIVQRAAAEAEDDEAMQERKGTQGALSTDAAGSIAASYLQNGVFGSSDRRLPSTPEAAPDFDSPLRLAAAAGSPARRAEVSLLQAAEGVVTASVPPLVGRRRAYKSVYFKSAS